MKANPCLQDSMTVELLPHQKRALAWMQHREQPGTKPPVAGGLLADDQGLGKTVTTIALLLKHPPTKVCPNDCASICKTCHMCRPW